MVSYNTTVLSLAYITQLIVENSSGGNQEVGTAFYLSMISLCFVENKSQDLLDI